MSCSSCGSQHGIRLYMECVFNHLGGRKGALPGCTDRPLYDGCCVVPSSVASVGGTTLFLGPWYQARMRDSVYKDVLFPLSDASVLFLKELASGIWLRRPATPLSLLTKWCFGRPKLIGRSQAAWPGIDTVKSMVTWVRCSATIVVKGMYQVLGLVNEMK